MCVYSVCVCVHARVSVCNVLVCMCARGQCSQSSFLHPISWDQAECGTHWFCWTGWVVSSRDTPVSADTAPGALEFYLGSWGIRTQVLMLEPFTDWVISCGPRTTFYLQISCSKLNELAEASNLSLWDGGESEGQALAPQEACLSGPEGGVSLVEYLPSIHETLGSISSTVLTGCGDGCL